MRPIIDVGVGTAVEGLLREGSHDVLAVREVDPRWPDEQILARAVRERRLVVTMDKGFSDLVYRGGLEHTGVLLLRLDDATGEEKRAVVRAIFEQYGEALPGRFSVYQDGRLRLRPALQS